MTALVRTLIFTHTSVFVAGFVAGKTINADELEMYRLRHESWSSRATRNARNMGIAAAVLGTVVVVSKIVSRARREF